jgi:hypothetical protein
MAAPATALSAELVGCHGARGRAPVAAALYGAGAPLYLAALNGDEEEMGSLLGAGCDADQALASVGGMTPLHVAAENGNYVIVQLLLAAGCERDRADDVGCTPLHVACRAGHAGVVAQLLAAGCCQYQANRLGERPLSVAAREGHHACVRELLGAFCGGSWTLGVAEVRTKVTTLVREHVQRLFLAFAMASHPRLGAQASAQGGGFFQPFIANADLLGLVYDKMVEDGWSEDSPGPNTAETQGNVTVNKTK